MKDLDLEQLVFHRLQISVDAPPLMPDEKNTLPPTGIAKVSSPFHGIEVCTDSRDECLRMQASP